MSYRVGKLTNFYLKPGKILLKLHLMLSLIDPHRGVFKNIHVVFGVYVFVVSIAVERYCFYVRDRLE